MWHGRGMFQFIPVPTWKKTRKNHAFFYSRLQPQKLGKHRKNWNNACFLHVGFQNAGKIIQTCQKHAFFEGFSNMSIQKGGNPKCMPSCICETRAPETLLHLHIWTHAFGIYILHLHIQRHAFRLCILRMHILARAFWTCIFQIYACILGVIGCGWNECHKGRKAAKRCVFPMFPGSGGSSSRLPK